MHPILYIFTIISIQLLHGAASEEPRTLAEFTSRSIRQWQRPEGYEYGSSKIICTGANWDFATLTRIMHRTSGDDTHICVAQSLDASPAVKHVGLWPCTTNIVYATKNGSRNAGLSALMKISGCNHAYRLVNEQMASRRVIALELTASPSTVAFDETKSWLATVDAGTTVNLYALREQPEVETDETFTLKAQPLRFCYSSPKMSPHKGFTLYTKPADHTEPLQAAFAFAHHTASTNIAVILHHMVMLWHGASGGKVIAEDATGTDRFCNGVFSHDDAYIYLVGNAIWSYNCHEKQLKKFTHLDIASNTEPLAIEVSPCNNYLAVAHPHKGVSIFETGTMQVVHQFLEGAHCTSLAYGSSSEQLATSSINEYQIGCEELWEIKIQETPRQNSNPAPNDSAAHSRCIVQ